MAALKHFDIPDVTRFMDARSSPDQVPVGGYRYVKNFGVEHKRKLCRTPGWTRFLDRSPYNNHDLHDQLLGITGLGARKPVNFLFEAESTFGTTKLLAGTEESLYALNITSGNWQVLWSGFGAPGLRLYAAQNEDVVLFTNGFDKPRAWVFDQPEIDGDSVSLVDDLEEMDITRVGVVISWAGSTFLMDVVQEGRAFQYRVLWSDFKNGLSYIKSADSIAGDQDLDQGEVILGALPMANVLLIYTTRGIWQVTSNADGSFGFAKRYDARATGEACLAFRNTLCSNGNEHIYGGQDGIYTYSLFKDKPELVEWIHRASSLIFEDVNLDRPDTHVAAYNPVRREVWFSWARSAENYPSQTFVINTQFPFTAVVDHGFNAFGVFQPREPASLLSDFLLNNCVCTPEELGDFEDTRSGGYCEAPSGVDCASSPDAFYTTVALSLPDPWGDATFDVETEDWNEADPSANALCKRLENETLSETCIAESKGAAKANRNFVMASASDYCLKQMSTVFYREHCTAFAPCGTYERRGFRSLLRSGPINVKDTEDEKRIQRFVMEAEAAAASVPGQIRLRIGTSAQATDPNQTACPIIWMDPESKDLQCLSESSEAEHKAAGTRPDTQYSWPMFMVGMNFYFELEVLNAASTPLADTGAAVCISRFTFFVDESRRRWS